MVIRSSYVNRYDSKMLALPIVAWFNRKMAGPITPLLKVSRMSDKNVFDITLGMSAQMVKAQIASNSYCWSVASSEAELTEQLNLF